MRFFCTDILFLQKEHDVALKTMQEYKNEEKKKADSAVKAQERQELTSVLTDNLTLKTQVHELTQKCALQERLIYANKKQPSTSGVDVSKLEVRVCVCMCMCGCVCLFCK